MHEAIAIQLANARVADLTADLHRDRARADARAARARRRSARERGAARRRLALAPITRLLFG